MNKTGRGNNFSEEQAALAFLRDDYNQCFEQMRYYDQQIVGIFKFLFVVYTFLTGVITAFYQYFLIQAPSLRAPAIVSLGVGLLLGIFLYAIIIRNRIYFVRTARYVNEQRAFFTAMRPLGFESLAPMYNRSDQPRHFNWASSQFWMLYIVAFLNAMVFYAIGLFTRDVFFGFAGVGVAVFVFCLQIAIAVLVLRSRD